MPNRPSFSIAGKLVLASALPSAVALVAGLGALVARSQRIAEAGNPELAFDVLRRGALLGTLLALTFAGVSIALAARHFLLKPIHQLMQAMGRAELGDFLVRAHVASDDEVGRLARSFNTMLSRVTDLAVAEIESRHSLAQMERELALQNELKALNEQLEAHIGEMELLQEVTKAVAGTLDLPEQLETLGHQVCARMGVDEFGVMLVDELTHELVVEAVAGIAPPSVRGLRFHLGEGITGEVAAKGTTTYVPDVEKEPRYLHYKGQRHSTGSFLAVPLRAKGHLLGVMNLIRRRVDAFSPQDLRIAEAIGAQAALAISNARLYQQTLELSFTDSLTGIPNRRQLFVRLEQELARSARFAEPLSVLMIDLDRFKQVNDRFGHATGDGVLRSVATTLRRNLRKVDILARYGGEEFCAVLPRTPRAAAHEVAEKLRTEVAGAALSAPADAPLRITVSIGVSTLGPGVEDVAALLDRADAALYRAKEAGRDRVEDAPEGPVPPRRRA